MWFPISKLQLEHVVSNFQVKFWFLTKLIGLVALLIRITLIIDLS